MKTIDIRIGNYYNSKNNKLIQCTKLNIAYLIGMCDNNELKPIVLTEDWLVYFGFEFDHETKYWSYNITK